MHYKIEKYNKIFYDMDIQFCLGPEMQSAYNFDSMVWNRMLSSFAWFAINEIREQFTKERNS